MTGFKKILIPLLFFSLILIFFYNLQFTTTNIPGYDGYYHIKMAEIIKTHGIIKKFDVKFPIIWSLLLLSSSHPFLFRMCFPRAPAIALIFLFAGLYMTFKKKYF